MKNDGVSLIQIEEHMLLLLNSVRANVEKPGEIHVKYFSRIC